MGESLLLITLITIIVLAIRRGKPVILDNPLVIERPGQYHITFAPQLNQAQKFVEAIASQFNESGNRANDLASQYFEVRDPIVKPKDADFYLLAITLRGSMLYIQAVNPLPSVGGAASQFKNVREFSDKVLARYPLVQAVDEQASVLLTSAVEVAASQLKVIVKMLHEAD